MIYELIIGIAVAWCFAKLLKLLQDVKQEKRFDWKFLLHDGGMPSAHTTAVVALVMGIFLEEGISILFVVTAVLALIVMNDAIKVRWITGEQSKAINRLAAGKKEFSVLEEKVGHTPAEVLVGATIGVLVPVLVYILI
ncbi:MAG: divergent PAP2 family protein [archaeon]